MSEKFRERFYYIHFIPVIAMRRDIKMHHVMVLQILALAVAGQAIFVVVSMNALGEYLYHADGFPLLLWGFIVPLISTMVVFVMALKRVFKQKPPRFFSRKNPYFIEGSGVIEMDGIEDDPFFPAGVDVIVATTELRPELARLHGELLPGTELETLPRINTFLLDAKPAYIGGCGDVISKNLLLTEFYPDLIVIDGMTCRSDYNATFPSSYTHITVKNITGGITREAWFTIKDVIASRTRTIVEVEDGEEDLLLVPMVLFSPDGAVMAYGQPPVTDATPPIPSGAVMVRVTEQKRAEFAALVRRFIPAPIKRKQG